jgi:hypothetical protein
MILHLLAWSIVAILLYMAIEAVSDWIVGRMFKER